jgi:hypothetical protein
MLTCHAEIRCQQRGIRPDVVQALLAYGRRVHRRGAEVCFMDRRARSIARTALGDQGYARVADRLDAYLVVGADGAIITAAKRHGRLKF